jgi:hypothetical protein
MNGWQPVSTSEKQRLLVVQRSDNRCEVEVELPGAMIWTRCFRQGIEVHHLLTRARGGDLLDRWGEIHHLMALCPEHHRLAHGPGGRNAGLLIDGSVILDSATGQLVYTGPDAYLSATYRSVA